MHSTTNLEDGYLGSGKRLGYSIAKHGKENHIKEILEFLNSREEMMIREKEIVNEELLKEERCMNLMKGGLGGDGMRNRSMESIKEMSRKGKISLRLKHEDPLWKKQYIEKMSVSLKEAVKNGTQNTATWKGKHLSESHRKSIGEANSISNKGSRNSQYGTCWIHSKEGVNKKVKKEELESWLINGWIKGAKFKK